MPQGTPSRRRLVVLPCCFSRRRFCRAAPAWICFDPPLSPRGLWYPVYPAAASLPVCRRTPTALLLVLRRVLRGRCADPASFTTTSRREIVSSITPPPPVETILRDARQMLVCGPCCHAKVFTFYALFGPYYAYVEKEFQ